MFTSASRSVYCVRRSQLPGSQGPGTTGGPASIQGNDADVAWTAWPAIQEPAVPGLLHCQVEGRTRGVGWEGSLAQHLSQEGSIGRTGLPDGDDVHALKVTDGFGFSIEAPMYVVTHRRTTGPLSDHHHGGAHRRPVPDELRSVKGQIHAAVGTLNGSAGTQIGRR